MQEPADVGCGGGAVPGDGPHLGLGDHLPGRQLGPKSYTPRQEDGPMLQFSIFCLIRPETCLIVPILQFPCM